MNTVGTYTEPLPHGGKLQVSKTAWSIEYYFPGPDLRYNGTFVHVQGSEAEKYIQAFINNWSEFETLKVSVPKGGEFSKVGQMGMTIRIGGYAEGVCIRTHHLPIKDKTKLDAVVQSYRYAIERDTQIKEFLSKL